VIYPKNFSDKVGFNKIREMIAEGCLSELGRQRVEQMSFLNSFDRIHTLVSQTAEFLKILQNPEPFPADYFLDVTHSLKKIRVQGTYLEVEELFDLKRSQETLRSILNFFKKSGKEEFPFLKNLNKDVKVYPYVIDSINSIITKQGKIKDKASSELSNIRKNLANRQNAVSKRMNTILKKFQSEGLVERDLSLVIRNGRTVIPINANYKRRIQGLIHDESATGKTAYIEPAEIVEMNNEIRELEYAEKRAIVKILTRFSDSIRPYLDDLLFSYNFLGIIDFIRAKALLAQKINAVKPEIQAKPGLNWKDAVHPLLYLTYRKENRKVVPLNIYLDEKTRILVISGPNAGGKSVCLQTVGLLQYMIQCGMLVPLVENSRMGIFNNICIDIGDEQSIENDLSTYSSRLLNMKFFIRNADQDTLFLIDEFGTGTEPALGGAIAESILGELNKKRTLGVLTTHYTNLKHYASSVEGIENGAMLFDSHRMEPLFRLEIGKPGSSFAFEIARKIGLPEEILKEATGKAGEGPVDFDKHLKDIARDKRYWENKKSRIKKTEKKLEEIIEQYVKELNDIKKLRNEIIGQANQEAKELLTEVNKKIENTIRIIKESNAEKERTREARRQLEDYREKIEKNRLLKERKTESKIDRLEKKEQQLRKAKPHLTEKVIDELKFSKTVTVVHVGDKVKMVGQETVGEVMDINQDSYLVSFGNIITTVTEKKLIRISNEEYHKALKANGRSRAATWNIGERKLYFVPEIDVRGKRAEEALRTVMEFIDEAIVVAAGDLRILHGKGDGVLRQIIRDYLKTVDLVKTFRDEHIERGGAGITVVELEF
jgi:DNA mismatch repair protein MutS2